MNDIDPPTGYYWMRSRCRNCGKDGLRHFGPIKSADKTIQKIVVCEYCGAEHKKSDALIGPRGWDRADGGGDPFLFWIGVVVSLGLFYIIVFIFRKFFKFIHYLLYGSLDTPYVLVRRWWK